MKKLLFMLVAIILLASCSKQGEISEAPRDFIKIHNKVYKLVKIVPCDNCRSIWIMYPKDSTDSMPVNLNYEYSEQQGKQTVTHTQSVIEIE